MATCPPDEVTALETEVQALLSPQGS